MRTFPIFVSFEGKPPLVVGGGELAAVKTRLLLKRAPIVDVAAKQVVAELAALAEAGTGVAPSRTPRHRSVARPSARHLGDRGRQGGHARLGHRPRARRSGQRARPARALHLRAAGHRRSRRGDGRDRHLGCRAGARPAPARLARAGAASAARRARAARGRVARRRRREGSVGNEAAEILGGRVRGRCRRGHARGRRGQGQGADRRCHRDGRVEAPQVQGACCSSAQVPETPSFSP